MSTRAAKAVKKPARAKAATAAAPEDHRSRTGAMRREQTRRKLLASAMAVFAEKGADAPSIDDFIAAAGVARGTFYNYFSTTQELLDAVSSELTDTVLRVVDEVVLHISNPLERLACGCLLYMHCGVDIPNWGAFVVRTGLRSAATGKLIEVYLPRDLELARRAGEVDYASPRAARDLIFGCVNQAVLSVHMGHAPRTHLRQMLGMALRGIGVPAERAQALSEMKLAPLTLPQELGFAVVRA